MVSPAHRQSKNVGQLNYRNNKNSPFTRVKTDSVHVEELRSRLRTCRTVSSQPEQLVAPLPPLLSSLESKSARYAQLWSLLRGEGGEEPAGGRLT